MSAALQNQPTDHLRGLLHLTQTLSALGVNVRFTTDVPHGDVGKWHYNTQTAHVRRDAHPGNQLWFLTQLLAFLTAGPAGSPAAQQQRVLRLVPHAQAGN